MSFVSLNHSFSSSFFLYFFLSIFLFCLFVCLFVCFFSHFLSFCFATLEYMLTIFHNAFQCCINGLYFIHMPFLIALGFTIFLAEI